MGRPQSGKCCCCNRNQASQFLPPKPTRPHNGFSLYFQKFYREQHDIKNYCWVERGELMADAGNSWWRLPQSTRNYYNNKACPSWENYRKAMETWKSKRAVLKKPATSYILYSAHIYKKRQRKGKGMCVSDLGRYAGRRWIKMSPRKKEKYRLCYRKNLQAYERRIQNLKDGTASLDDYVRR